MVLVGGGHAHVQVLRRFAMEPPPRARLTVIVDAPVAVYSGMVPGFVAGQYREHELEIDVVPLARRAGARVVLAPATGIDAGGRRIEVEGRAPIPYDVASLDVGSTVAGLELPGIREHAFPTRPIGRFVERIDELMERAARADGAFQVVVVGGGAGGVELAFCLERRLAAAGIAAEVALLESGERILGGYPDSLVRRVERDFARRGIEIRLGARVTAAEPSRVVLGGGDELPCDALLWVTGAVSHPLFAASGLATDSRGFLRVRSTLQAEGFDDLFAVGDCATLIEHPETPKAGVYAVRQGPVVTRNLAAFLAGERLETYTPQGDFLTLLNRGDGAALGAKWGLAIEGDWVMRLKDWIDRRFMRRFQVLAPGGGPTAAFSSEPGMGGVEEMVCGGCAAKVGRDELVRVLERLGAGPPDPAVELGLAEADDAAAYRLPGGERVVSSVDAFPAFTDDPWLVGRVAAVNALSDLYAKGVAPRWAQALVTVPAEGGEETLFQALAGARAALDPLAVTLLGGHSTTGPELTVGFVVEGLAAGGEPLLRLDGLEPGQALILTKALGTGVLFHADMRGLARGPWIQAALASMVRPNAAASRVARELGATAASDVTGFGLAGHLSGMLAASGAGAEIALDALPALPGALELLARGERSTFHPQNEGARGGLELAPEAAADPRLPLVFDPQTSGGLLFGVAEALAADAVARLRRAGDAAAARIGRVTPPGGAPLRVVVSPGREA